MNEDKIKEKAFVDSLFEGYEETAELADFKEELLGNLNAKIDNLVKKGMDNDAAFGKASAELGDISALANELSQKKRTEVFEEVYMDIRQYMSPKRVSAYVIFGVIAAFGAVSGLITLFAVSGDNFMTKTFLNLTSFFAVIMPFLTTSIIGFTFLGVTQETASLFPLSKKRGAWYAAAAGLIAFGFLTMPIIFFSTKFWTENFVYFFTDTTIISDFIPKNLGALVPVFSCLIPFVLPGIGILVYLCLTEKDRQKPWAKNLYNKTMKEEMEIWNDPVFASRFGMFSGAIWIFGFGLFMLLGFLIGFKYSWLVFIFSAAIQLLVQASMITQKCKTQHNET